MSNDQVLVLATVIGPVGGVILGWLLNEWSARARLRRAEASARFAVARGLMRHRHSPDLSAYVNEIPLYFSGDEPVMTLYRELVYGRSTDPARDLTQLILAVVRRAGITSDLEQEDVTRYLSYDASRVLAS